MHTYKSSTALPSFTSASTQFGIRGLFTKKDKQNQNFEEDMEFTEEAQENMTNKGSFLSDGKQTRRRDRQAT